MVAFGTCPGLLSRPLRRLLLVFPLLACLADARLPAMAGASRSRLDAHDRSAAASHALHGTPGHASHATATECTVDHPTVAGTQPPGYEWISHEVVMRHHEWHICLHPDATDWVGDPVYGAEFRRFHHDLIEEFQRWREQHGYARIEPFITGPDATAPVGHTNRNGFNRPAGFRLPSAGRPSYYTIEGGSVEDPYFTTEPGYYTTTTTMKRRLADYRTVEELGRSIADSWHKQVHIQLGLPQFRAGAAGDIGTADIPNWDPLFYHWHLYVDTVFRDWDRATGRVQFLPLVRQ